MLAGATSAPTLTDPVARSAAADLGNEYGVCTLGGMLALDVVSFANFRESLGRALACACNAYLASQGALFLCSPARG